jgi:1-acyl-sn-glycerol-3-phosphate acyltransferase
VKLVHVAKLLGITINTVLMAPVVVATAVVDPRRAYRQSLFWARANLQLSRVGVRVVRRAALDPARPYVIMSNHASLFDALAVVAALPEFQLRWVAKRELANVPVFGWALRRAGHIIIDRTEPGRALAALRGAKAQMDGGISVVIFPEGTREEHDHELLRLKKGGFVLAIETGVPIVPVAVRGSRAILQRDDWRINGGEIEVVLGAPIPVVGRKRAEIMADVEAFLARELDAVPVRPVAHVAEAR